MPTPSYHVNQKIDVYSSLEEVYARNTDGTLIQAIPGISIHVVVNGTWDSKELMRADLTSCINSLVETFDDNVLCRNNQ